ncbi:cytochrome P450 [Microbacterium sp. X-17]|uniref:cytochrome P450 n=1 Tax=Microbacterium sp. X-17 TaxID=3144404 RepID=UPI0031F572D0
MSITADSRENAAPDGTAALFRLEDAAVRCPFLAYEKQRSETPVYWEPAIEAFVVTRYDDIVGVTGQPNLFSNRMQSSPAQAARLQEASMALLEREPELFAQGGEVREAQGVLLNADPPQHSRHRSVVNRAFSVRQVRNMEDQLTQMVDELIDAFDTSGEIDIIPAFGVPLPLKAVSSVLGAPTDHLERFKRWSDDFLKPLSPTIGPDDLKTVIQTQGEFYALFNSLLDDRLENPQDDLLTVLAQAAPEGEPLTRAEQLEISMAVLVAGNDTSTKLIAACVLRLAREPELAAQLREDPDLVAQFVEEMLRLEAPAQGMFRYATEDTEVGGVAIPAGSMLYLAYASGNRDGARFDDPDEIRLDGRDGTPHLSLGHGIHFCLGAPLARAEIRIAMQRLLARFSDISTPLTDADLDYFVSYQFRGLNSLPVRLTPA